MSFGPPRAACLKRKTSINTQSSSGKVKNKNTILKSGSKVTEENKIFSSTLNCNATSVSTLASCDISEIQTDCKPKSTKKQKNSNEVILEKGSNLSSEDKLDILNAELIQLMYALEVQSKTQAAMKKNYEERIAALKIKESEAHFQAINAIEWVQDVHTVCQETLLLGENEKQFIELFDEAKKLEDLLSDLSSGVRNKFSQLHLNHVALNTNSYDTFLNGLIQMSNMLQNIIEIVNEKSPYCGHLETVKDVQQLLSKISQCIDECHELMLSGYDKVLEVLFQKTLLNK